MPLSQTRKWAQRGGLLPEVTQPADKKAGNLSSSVSTVHDGSTLKAGTVSHLALYSVPKPQHRHGAQRVILA